MASADDFSVVPPPPTFPTETYHNYKVFPDDVEQTIDQILDEEADLEESRSSDWPFYSGADESRASPASDSSRNGDSEKTPAELSLPREMTKSTAKKTKKSTKPKKKKKRDAATREITVIDLCSDDGDHGPEDMDIDHDKHDEHDDSEEMNGNGNLRTLNNPAADAPQTLNNVITQTAKPGPIDEKDAEANTVINETNASKTASPKEGGRSVKDREEEAFIFSSVSQSVKNRVMCFILRHPFMCQFVQPVKRSARRQFTTELVAKAQSAGLDFSKIWNLIKYVRTLYLDRAGVNAEPLAASLADIPFGQEIHDDEIPLGQDIRDDSAPALHSRKSRKRSREEGSSVGSKTKKRKRRLLDQDPVQPASVPEVIEIADDETSTSPPELPDASRASGDEQNAVIQDQGTPEKPVVCGDEFQNEIAKASLVVSTHELPSHQPDDQTQSHDGEITTVQDESMPNLPPNSSDTSVSDTEEVNPIRDPIESTLPIEETTSARKLKGASEDAQEVSDSAWVGEKSNDGGIHQNKHETEISPRVEKVELRKKSNSIVASRDNQSPPVELSRNARRNLLRKGLKEGKMAKAEDDTQPALSLQKTVVSEDSNDALTSHESATTGTALDNECVPGNLDESNGPAEHVTDLIEENLFPNLPSEPSIKSSTKLSKNQKRQERKRARREQNAKKRQERKERSQNAEQQPPSPWLKHHSELKSQDNQVRASLGKQWQIPVPSSKQRARNPEPRKEKKRRAREHRREQKKARRLKRESLKFELERNVTDNGHDQDDQLPKEEPQLEQHGAKERRQQRKRQKHFLALDHSGDDLNNDLDESVQLSNGSREPPKLANDGGQKEISPSHDVPKVQVDAAREIPQPKNAIEKESGSVSNPKLDGSVNKTSVWDPTSTPQRQRYKAVSMPMSTPTSQSTSASRSRYGPLSPDPKEWDSDF